MTKGLVQCRKKKRWFVTSGEYNVITLPCTSMNSEGIVQRGLDIIVNLRWNLNNSSIARKAQQHLYLMQRQRKCISPHSHSNLESGKRSGNRFHSIFSDAEEQFLSPGYYSSIRTEPALAKSKKSSTPTDTDNKFIMDWTFSILLFFWQLQLFIYCSLAQLLTFLILQWHNEQLRY